MLIEGDIIAFGKWILQTMVGNSFTGWSDVINNNWETSEVGALHTSDNFWKVSWGGIEFEMNVLVDEDTSTKKKGQSNVYRGV